MAEATIPFETDEIINAPGDFPTIDHPWEYRGWNIFRWTGWKGNWCRKNPAFPGTLFCKGCDKPIESWDIVYITWERQGLFHVECAQKEKYNYSDGSIAGQWLATDVLGYQRESRYMYASSPGSQSLFDKGALFNIVPLNNQLHLTYLTDPEDLDVARDEALCRLRALIDSEVEKHADL